MVFTAKLQTWFCVNFEKSNAQKMHLKKSILNRTFIKISF